VIPGGTKGAENETRQRSARGFFCWICRRRPPASDLKTSNGHPQRQHVLLSYYGARDAGIFRKHGIESMWMRVLSGVLWPTANRQVLVGTYADSMPSSR